MNYYRGISAQPLHYKDQRFYSFARHLVEAGTSKVGWRDTILPYRAFLGVAHTLGYLSGNKWCLHLVQFADRKHTGEAKIMIASPNPPVFCRFIILFCFSMGIISSTCHSLSKPPTTGKKNIFKKEVIALR